MESLKVWLIRRSRSKTYRFAAFMAGVMALEANLELIQQFIPGNVYAYFAIILNVGIAYYREVTKQPLSAK